MGRKLLKYFLLLCVMLLVDFFIFSVIDIDFKLGNSLLFSVKSDVSDDIQIFYIFSEGENWSEEQSLSVRYGAVGEYQNFSVNIPAGATKVRMDPGRGLAEVSISDMKLKSGFREKNITDTDGALVPLKGIERFEITHDSVNIKPLNDDPYFLVDIEKVGVDNIGELSAMLNMAAKTAACVIASAFIIVIGLRFAFVRSFIKGIWDDRKLIMGLAKNDFKTKYAGSLFGVLWAFVQPIVTVLVYWFVFQVGLRSPSVGDYPFALWLVSGLVPWFFFSDALMGGTNSLFEYSYLVKKVVFKISVIPIVKIISALFVHLFFICFTLVLLEIYGYHFSAYTLQVLYYAFALFVFTLGVVYMTCAVVLFFKDLGQIINIVLQVVMWFTPIMWSYTMVGEEYRIFFKLNPLFYIVQGFRDSLLDHYFVWQRVNYSMYFWIITIGLFGVGAIVFRKLKVHFADVL